MKYLILKISDFKFSFSNSRLISGAPIKKFGVHVINILEYYNDDFEVLDKVLMDNHYILILDFVYIVVNPNVIHKMKFHLQQ
jgi:hypothetical protein